MKTTLELLPEGKWLATFEESTKTMFRTQPFDPLPGTVIRGEGKAKSPTKAMRKAMRKFEKDTLSALTYYLLGDNAA